ncbi:hypothetical protein TCON_0471 [Astathelohania contejeani]|uniref:Pyrimidine 5-nucleotidase n=1 Tax=Astathelohania contejeani TaxID=164912 RepID=A0ABQ7I1N5_9MICR|nr:hypothetical protein TCON_0471 [Thelohania contejeani]
MLSILSIFIALGQKESVNINYSLGDSEKILIFDIDKTLYPQSIPIYEAITEGKLDYITKNMDMSRKKIIELLKDYKKKYGSSIKGFATEHKLNVSACLSYVLEFVKEKNILNEDQELKTILDSIPYRKFVFTNADMGHAKYILTALGILDCFEVIFYTDYNIKDCWAKPEIRCYKYIEETLGITNPKNIYFFDDSICNILQAKNLDWQGFHVTSSNTIKKILKNNYLDNE